MRIAIDFPPNIDAIKAVFPIRGRGVIFCYGDTIFNPDSVVVPPRLVAHETVHSMSQGGDPAGWWEKYLTDEEFRLAEEILAHRAEYRCALHDANRNQRRQALKLIATRLSGPLYGRMLSLDEAKRVINMEIEQ